MLLWLKQRSIALPGAQVIGRGNRATGTDRICRLHESVR